MSAEIKKKYAFISYSHKDEKIAKWLQRRLESYKLPAEIHNECENSRYLRPIFRDRSDLNTGILANELRTNLENSKYLIVICSPHSAKSEWVGKEIEYFHQLGRTQNIYFFIVDGQPHSGNPATECFNPIAHKLGLPEILGANIHEKIFKWSWLNKERAYIQLISKLLIATFNFCSLFN